MSDVVLKIQDTRIVDERLSNLMRANVNATLTASGWVGSQAPYSQTISNALLAGVLNVELHSVLTNTMTKEQQRAYISAYTLISQGYGIVDNGTVTIYVFDKPTIDVEVRLTCSKLSDIPAPIDPPYLVYLDDNDKLQNVKIDNVDCISVTASTITTDGKTIDKSKICYAYLENLSFPYDYAPPYFLSKCSSLVGIFGLPATIRTIGNSFLSDCSSFNQKLYLPNVESIGDYFLYNNIRYNQTIDLPKVQSIGASFLGQSTQFASNIYFPMIVTIGSSFLSGCTNFRLHYMSRLTLPTTLTYIGNSFLGNCRNFSGSLTVPSSLTFIGDSFLSSCDSLLYVVVECSAAVAVESAGTLATLNQYANSYIQGVSVTGTYATEWKTKFPNSTTSYRRNLK